MGKPISSNVEISIFKYIEYRREPGEVKHLSTKRKRKQSTLISRRVFDTVAFRRTESCVSSTFYSLSSGERKGNSLNPINCFCLIVCLRVNNGQN